MGGGPVLWLEMEDDEEEDDDEEEEEDEDRDRSLGSPLKAASPVGEQMTGKKGEIAISNAKPHFQNLKHKYNAKLW